LCHGSLENRLGFSPCVKYIHVAIRQGAGSVRLVERAFQENHCPVWIDPPPLRFFDGVSLPLCEQPLPKDPEKVGKTGPAARPSGGPLFLATSTQARGGAGEGISSAA